MIYQWKGGFPTRKVDPTAAGRQLEAIRRVHKTITAELIVEDAQRPETALHPIFEWDNGEAARLYRLQQARNVCQALVFIRKEAPDRPAMRAFVHVSSYDEVEGRYEKIQIVMKDPNMRQQALSTAWRELQAWRARYDDYKEFARIVSAIEEVAPEIAV